VMFGGIMMSIGHFILAIPQDWSFFYGMAFIICGNGFFKPNISSLVGTLYSNNDPRKDSAFSLFYMGINIGAALGGLICGYVVNDQLALWIWTCRNFYDHWPYCFLFR
jgi:Dipeptide/tripeptide permease